jgi:hypothetical protein
MKSLIQLTALALIVSFSMPAYAEPYEDVPNQAACEQRGGVWDREAGKCVAKNRRKACQQRGGTWDEGSSTCSVPKQEM